MYEVVNTAIKRRSLIDSSYSWLTTRGGRGSSYNGLIPVASARKGYFCQASGKWKARNFNSWSIWKPGREICHFGLYNNLKGFQKDFNGCEWKLVVGFNHDSAFTAVKRDAKVLVNGKYSKGVPPLTKLCWIPPLPRVQHPKWAKNVTAVTEEA